MELYNNTLALLKKNSGEVTVLDLLLFLSRNQTARVTELYNELTGTLSQIDYNLLIESLDTGTFKPVNIELFILDEDKNKTILYSEITTIKDFYSLLPSLIEPRLGVYGRKQFLSYFNRGLVLSDDCTPQKIRAQILVGKVEKLTGLAIDSIVDVNVSIGCDKDISKPAVATQLKGTLVDLGNLSEEHLFGIAAEGREPDMKRWYKQLEKDAPEVRRFDILVSHEKEVERLYHFTGTLSKLRVELTEIFSAALPHHDISYFSGAQLRYNEITVFSAMCKYKNADENISFKVTLPFNHVITMHPLDSK